MPGTTASKTTTRKAVKAGAPKQEAGKAVPAAKETQSEKVVQKAEKNPGKVAAKAASVPKKADPVPKEKAKKPKLVRDSFTMPEAEYAVLGEVKKACLKAGIEVKKSELLRVGVALIRQLDTGKLQQILADLPALKAGRPKKSK